MLRQRTIGFITLLIILVLTLAACGEMTPTATNSGTTTSPPTVAANTQTKTVSTTAAANSTAATTARNNATNAATTPAQTAPVTTASGQTTAATSNNTPATVATTSSTSPAAPNPTTSAVTTVAPANRTTAPVAPGTTTPPSPSVAATKGTTAASDSDAVYQALQKAYQNKGFKLSGSLTQDAKKSSQIFELSPPDKLHGIITAPDGKVTERIIIGNDSYTKAANGGWTRDQSISLTKQLNALGLLNPTQALDLFKNADVTKKQDAQVNGETLRVIEVSFDETQTVPEGLPSAPQLNYYLDKNGYIKRITMFNIGGTFTYDLTDYNSPVNISTPA